MAQEQPPAGTSESSVGAFIGGIFAGMVAGGIIFLVAIGTLSIAFGNIKGNGGGIAMWGLMYLIAVLLGWASFMMVRRNVNFLSGLLVGATCALLGSTFLCNMIIVSSV